MLPIHGKKQPFIYSILQNVSPLIELWPKLFHAFLVFPFTDGKVSKVDVLVIHFVSNDNTFDYQGDFLKDDPCG